jgi:S1-C subfamily serine protease
VDGVKDEGPGASSGLLAGDIIISMNGQVVLNIQDYMKLLASFEEGQSVPIKVKRGDEIIDLLVQF